MRLTLTYDAEVDALAVDFVPRTSRDTARTEELDEFRRIDYGEDGTVLGLDLTNVSDGVNFDGLPRGDELAEALRNAGLGE